MYVQSRVGETLIKNNELTFLTVRNELFVRGGGGGGGGGGHKL